MAVAVDGAPAAGVNPLAPEPAATLGTAATPLRLLLAPDGASAALALAGGLLTVLEVGLAVGAGGGAPALAAGGGGASAPTVASPALAAVRQGDLARSSPGAAAARAVVGLAGAVGGALATPGRALLGRGGRGSGGGGGGDSGPPTPVGRGAAPSGLPSVALGSEVKCLAFDSAGTTLAAGCEDGVVRFFAWPALSPAGQVKPASPADEAAAAAAASGAAPVPGGPRPRPPGTADGVRDIDFAPGDGGSLAVVWESGGARVVGRDGGPAGPPLPLSHAPLRAAAAGVPPARRGVAGAGRPVIGRARFVPAAAAADGGPRRRLVATVGAGGRGWAAAWEEEAGGGGAFTPVPGRAGAAHALPSPATAASLSPCGALLGLGSADGDVAIVDAATLRVMKRVRGAHMVFVTALAFSPPTPSTPTPGKGGKRGSERAMSLVSVSGDASAVVTRVGGGGGAGRAAVVTLVLLLLLLLALALLAQGGPAAVVRVPPSLAHALATVKAELAGVRRAVAAGGGGRFAVAGDQGEL